MASQRKLYLKQHGTLERALDWEPGCQLHHSLAGDPQQGPPFPGPQQSAVRCHWTTVSKLPAHPPARGLLSPRDSGGPDLEL